MVERVRPASSGDNVTDATIVEALRASAATYRAQEEAAEVAKSARSAHSNEIKKWKKRGLHTEALKRAVKDRFVDPAEVLSELHNYTRMRALQNFPTIQTDLVAMWTEIDLPDETRDEIARQRFRDDGAFCARQGQLRDANPHQAGSEGHQQWDAGWLHDQERIARAMGAGDAPVANGGSRARPVRKQATKKKAAPVAPSRRRRTAEVPLH
jgi:hypothetical protein